MEELKVQIYGSMATGLAIENSDMDFVVQGLQIFDREQLLACIELLYYSIQSQTDFAKNCVMITTAKVPIIKLVFYFFA